MNNLEIDTETVKECSSKLADECELYNAEIKKFLENVNSLASVWTTEAQKSFSDAALSNEEFYNRIGVISNNFADLYNYAAVRYENTDTEAGDATSSFR